MENDTVEISIPISAKDAADIEFVWEHREMFGWKTRNDMLSDMLMAGYWAIKASEN